MLWTILRSEIYFILFFGVAGRELAQVRKLQEFSDDWEGSLQLCLFLDI